MAALPAPHPEELALLTSPKDFKGGRTSTSKADTSPFLASGPLTGAVLALAITATAARRKLVPRKR